MPLHVRTVTAALIALVPACLASAATLKVPGDFPTINDAVAASSPGDVIELSPGDYFETVVLTNRELTIRSATGDPDDVLLKMADDNIIRVAGTSEVVLQGLTFNCINATAVTVTGDAVVDTCRFIECLTPTFGAAIQVPSAAGFVDVRNSEFRQCIAGTFGAAVYVTGGGGAVIADSRFEDCDAAAGAVFCFSGSVSIARSWFEDNNGGIGTIGTDGAGNMLVSDSVITGNVANAPISSNGVTKITNVTIDGNSSSEAGLVRGAGDLVVTNSIARDPSGLPPVFGGGLALTAEYSNIQGGVSGPGMIDATPLYVGNSFNLDAGSPGIDAAAGSAASAADFNGGDRSVDDPNIPNSGTGAIPFVDMGAFERVSRIRYVDATATPGTGRSWNSPYRDLQDALDDAAANPADVREIWLADGFYRPDRGTGDRSMAFEMRNALDILGGFAGGETKRDQSDFPNNISVLTGEINGSGLTDNAYQVVRAFDVGSSGSLRAVAIERGYANGGSSIDQRGGGLLVLGGAPRFDQIWVRQCSAAGSGQGIRLEDSNASFARLRVNRCGVSNLFGRGAISVSGGQTSFTQVLVHGNTTVGGAVFDFVDMADADVSMATIAGNTSTQWVAGIGAFLSTVRMTNSIVVENIALSPIPGQPASQANEYNTMKQWTTIGALNVFDGPGTNGFDPRFVDPDGADNVPGTADDNYRLAAGSCLIDSGNNTLLPGGVTLDIVGGIRRLDDPGTADSGVGSGAIVDRGAYEFDGISCRPDLDGDGDVAFGDLLVVLAAFGPCDACTADLNCDGNVTFDDLLAVLSAFGPCP